MKKGVYFSNTTRNCLVCLLTLLLCACFQRFEEIRVVETSQGIAFDVPKIEAGLKKGQVYELLDLTVMRRECEEDCTMWFVVRKSSQVRTENLESARIVYGLEPRGMDPRTRAKPLRPGSFSVSATVQQYDAAGQLITSLSLEGLFSIYQDESGNLRVTRAASTGDKFWLDH